MRMRRWSVVMLVVDSGDYGDVVMVFEKISCLEERVNY